MATKDWKKTVKNLGEDNESILFTKKGHLKDIENLSDEWKLIPSNVFMYRSIRRFIDTRTQKNKKIDIWRVRLITQSQMGKKHIGDDRDFKTKSQALKFAKTYMKRH